MSADELLKHLGKHHTAEFSGVEVSLKDELIFLCRRDSDACVLVRYEYDAYENRVDEYTVDPRWPGDWASGAFTDLGRREAKGLRLDEAAAVALLRLRTYEGPTEPGLYETSEGELYVARTRLEAVRAVARETGEPHCLCAYRLEGRSTGKRRPYTRHAVLQGELKDLVALYKKRGAHRVGAYRLVLGAAAR